MSPKWNEYKENMSKHITEKCKKVKTRRLSSWLKKKKDIFNRTTIRLRGISSVATMEEGKQNKYL